MAAVAVVLVLPGGGAVAATPATPAPSTAPSEQVDVDPRPGPERTPSAAEVSGDDGITARSVLTRSVVAARTRPHVGDVTVVTFGLDGPRIAEVGVRVGTLGRLELRRPSRWVLQSPDGALVRTVGGPTVLTPAGSTAALDVEAVLGSREAEVLDDVVLDTGPATPVVLRRQVGAPIVDTLYVDADNDLLVRRETRDADGRVLRVVAYTRLQTVDTGGPGRVIRQEADPVPEPALADDEDADDVAALPVELGGGFRLVSSEERGSLLSARYSDGLSVLSVYHQEGSLDTTALAGATMVEVADRHVWSWPGTEPLRLVWNGGGRTWTAVTDAPLAVVGDAVGSLPGDLVGQDVVARVVRGIDRAADRVAELFG